LTPTNPSPNAVNTRTLAKSNNIANFRIYTERSVLSS
jgi:hypothetical protein